MLPAPRSRLRFPVEEKVPESLLHVELRTLLWRLLQQHFGHLGTAGTDQFVYWDPRDPRKNMAPDVYFGIGPQPLPITSWKTWERGVPDLAIEIVSDADSSARAKEKSVERYVELGVRELLRFDCRGAKRNLEAWDIVAGVARPRIMDTRLVTPCHTLGGSFVVAETGPLGATLRLARDLAGSDLLPTDREETTLAKRLLLDAKKQARDAQKQARDAQKQAKDAEARIAELTAALAASRTRPR